MSLIEVTGVTGYGYCLPPAYRCPLVVVPTFMLLEEQETACAWLSTRSYTKGVIKVTLRL
jgi:hypothetical protein